MLLKLIASIGLVLSIAVQAFLLLMLAKGTSIGAQPAVWAVLHVLSSGVAAVCITFFAAMLTPGNPKHLCIYTASLCVSMPFVGAVGGFGALIYGIHHSNNRHEENVYWQFTKNAELPFTAPIGRQVAKVDSRGFIEQITYSNNSDEVYKKILAAGNIRNVLSVGALKSAVKHSDDRIRLTAYQTLDRKVTGLNKEIQKMEAAALGQGSKDQSNTWLQIASNYWELLTLEKDEPIAREQLLNKAYEAALQSIKILPTNRNAHFTLGRIALLQNKDRMAAVAFDRAMALGMPIEKAMPYRAEVAFAQRDFKKVAESINSLDDSFKAYPPLSHLAGYWS